jgi:hypothetical protein
MVAIGAGEDGRGGRAARGGGGGTAGSGGQAVHGDDDEIRGDDNYGCGWTRAV